MSNQGRAVSIFNRLVVTVLALLVILAAALYARDPNATMSLAGVNLDQFGLVGVNALAIAIGCGLLAFFVLLVEIWPRSREPVYEARIDGGTMEYAASVVAAAIHRDLRKLDGLRGSQVDVAGSGSQVHVKVKLESLDGSDAPGVASRVSTQVRETLKQLGLEVGSIRLKFESAVDLRQQALSQTQPVPK
jgi:uncharacterized alkaline shock family protein YloU